MTAFEFWTGAWWSQVWPNLAASILWVTPALIAHFVKLENTKNDLKSHITSEVQKVTGKD